MKRTNLGLALISLLLILALAVNLTGCTKASATNLMDGITPNKPDLRVELNSQGPNVSDFAVRLFKACENNGENTLISPLSVLYALAMTANGAVGETLSQMETVLGMTVDEYNAYLYTYMNFLPDGDKNKLKLANSIWFNDDDSFTVKQDFLQTNADYYGADIYKSTFNDQTCKEINGWVKEKTDGMITDVLKNLSPEAVMCLVNALAFEAEWAEVYAEHQVEKDEFIKEDGTKQHAEFMHGTERAYLEDEKSTGFIKKYKGGKYAFVAMLPKDGISVSEYIASLDGKALNVLLSNPQDCTIHTSIPKFETGYDVEMRDVLKDMGMDKAFDSIEAEFEGLGTSAAGNIFISSVLHKTYISVGEQGTKAGAATAVIMDLGCVETPQDTKEVYLDRPFVYMLVDCENNIPFFIGTMMDIEK